MLLNSLIDIVCKASGIIKNISIISMNQFGDAVVELYTCWCWEQNI